MINQETQNFMDIVKKGIYEVMIEGLRREEFTPNSEELKELVYVSIDTDYVFDLLKAIGLVHFNDDEKAQLIINDFIGLLKDMYSDGEITLTEFKNNRRV